MRKFSESRRPKISSIVSPSLERRPRPLKRIAAPDTAPKGKGGQKSSSLWEIEARGLSAVAAVESPCVW